MANRQTWRRFHPPVTECLNTFAPKQTDRKHENAINPWIIWYFQISATTFIIWVCVTNRRRTMVSPVSYVLRECSLQLFIIYGDWHPHEPVYGHDHPPPTSQYWGCWCLPEHQCGQMLIRSSVCQGSRMWHKELHCNTLSPKNIIFSSIKNS